MVRVSERLSIGGFLSPQEQALKSLNHKAQDGLGLYCHTVLLLMLFKRPFWSQGVASRG